MSAQRCFPKLEDSGDNQQQLEPATRQLSDIATLDQFISFLLDVKWYRHFHTEPCIHRHHARRGPIRLVVLQVGEVVSGSFACCSSPSQPLDVVWRAGVDSSTSRRVTDSSSSEAVCSLGQRQLRWFRVHPRHRGFCSSHFFLRTRHVRQPVRTQRTARALSAIDVQHVRQCACQEQTLCLEGGAAAPMQVNPGSVSVRRANLSCVTSYLYASITAI